MLKKYDFEAAFDYENGFYLTASVSRFSKLVSHLDLFRLSMTVPGEIVECGVFKGASLMRWIKFRELLSNSSAKKIIGFDTFGKFPKALSKSDELLRKDFVGKAGDKSISKDQIITIIKKLNLYQNIDLINGDVNKTIPNYLENNPELKISLLHIDVDLYDPTKICLNLLCDRVASGGIIILDDYGAFPGATKAIDEYFEKNAGIIKKLPISDQISFVQKQ